MLSLNQPLPGLMSLSICYPLVIPVAIHIEALGLTNVTSTGILGYSSDHSLHGVYILKPFGLRIHTTPLSIFQ